MKNKILVIGSQGYLGSRLIEYLAERGCNCKTMDTGFFKNSILYNSKYLDAINKDARDIEIKDIENFDVVILLAGISNDPFGNLNPNLIYNPTREYALGIAKMCKELGIKFIFPSSCSVYGAAGNNKLDEKGKTNPQTGYSRNKIQIEDKLKKISNDKFRPIALRFATIYGLSPRIRFDVVVNMLVGLAITTNKIKLNSNGQAWRPNLHIDDACEAIYCCIKWKPSKPGLQILNVGQNEDNCKILDIANLIKTNIKGSTIEFLNTNEASKDNSLITDKKIQDGVDSRTYIVSFDKILKELPGFKCKWNLEKGISELINNLINKKLTYEEFNSKMFYRLQQIEYLYEHNSVDDNLRWIKK